MHLQTMWHDFAAQQGNAPGAHKGDVVVTFTQPIGGETEVTLPSDDVTFAAEAGNMLGVQLLLPDGRRLFAMASSVVGIVDAPLQGRAERKGDRPATGGVRPEETPGQAPADPAVAEAEQARRDAEQADLEARIPAGNRTPEQAERAAKREREAAGAQRAAEAGDARASKEAEAEHKRASERGGDGVQAPVPGDQVQVAGPGQAADEQGSAAHDKAEAAHDKSEAAADKAAARRRPGR